MLQRIIFYALLASAAMPAAAATPGNGGASFAPIRLYWFAGYTLHPDTALVR